MADVVGEVWVWRRPDALLYLLPLSFAVVGEMMRTTPFKCPVGVLIVTPFAPPATMAPRVLEDVSVWKFSRAPSAWKTAAVLTASL